MQRKSWVFSLVVFTCGYAHVAVAQEITVMISGGFSAALDKLAPDYQQKSGNTLSFMVPRWGNPRRRYRTAWRQGKRRMW